MKFLKTLLLIVLSLTLTGCYTQLQHTQQGHRITDAKPTEGYSWDSDTDDNQGISEADSIYIAETQQAKPYTDNIASSGTYDSDEYDEASYDDEYIPIDYKNYDIIDKYDACNCNPYKTYSIFDDPYYFPSYASYSYNGFYSPYYRYYRPYGSYFGLGLYNHSFAFSFGWGSGFYHHFNSFYAYPPYYGYGWYPSAYYSNYYFFGNNYYQNSKINRSDRRYGRRSIGTNRVGNSRTRVNSAGNSSRSRVTGTTNTRSRTSGVTRVRSTGSRSKVTRTRSRGGSSRVGNTRSRSSSGTKVKRNRTRSRSGNGSSGAIRSRGKVSITNSASSRNRSSISRKRLGTTNGLRTIDRTSIYNNLKRQRISLPKTGNNARKRSFFGTFGRFFNNSFNRSSNTGSRGISIPRSSSSKSGSTLRSRSSSSKSSVSRSRSSSSKSSSRSRSSGGGSKKRSRGGN